MRVANPVEHPCVLHPRPQPYAGTLRVRPSHAPGSRLRWRAGLVQHAPRRAEFVNLRATDAELGYGFRNEQPAIRATEQDDRAAITRRDRVAIGVEAVLLGLSNHKP